MFPTNLKRQKQEPSPLAIESERMRILYVHALKRTWTSQVLFDLHATTCSACAIRLIPSASPSSDAHCEIRCQSPQWVVRSFNLKHPDHGSQHNDSTNVNRAHPAPKHRFVYACTAKTYTCHNRGLHPCCTLDVVVIWIGVKRTLHMLQICGRADCMP